MIFRARQFEFTLPRPVLVMGIVNVTPDSFSDGGKFLDTAAAVAHGLELAAQGAEILDIGGESTRPGATPVGEAEELRRVLPVIEKLVEALHSNGECGTRSAELGEEQEGKHSTSNIQRPTPNGAARRNPVLISVDTTKPAVARAALQAGASIVNDIAANRTDPALWNVVAEFRAGYVCMHMQGTPQTMQIEPHYADVVEEIGEFFAERLARLKASGVAAEQVVLDPGIGFGKTTAHNLRLLAGLGRFARFGRPLLAGISRKAFLGKLTGKDATERLPSALACATLAVAEGVHMLRTHDVAATVQAVRTTEAVLKQTT